MVFRDGLDLYWRVGWPAGLQLRQLVLVRDTLVRRQPVNNEWERLGEKRQQPSRATCLFVAIADQRFPAR
jgi:hypothetical protein